MVVFTEVFFNIENISNKDIILFGSFKLKPGLRTDLFKSIPGLSEARIIDALRAPSGELHTLAVVHKKIAIHEFKLAAFDNVFVDAAHVKAANSPERGKVLGFDGADFKWVSGGGSHVEVESPLSKEGESIKLSRAGAHSSGYLSKEDWLHFSNTSTGFRIWQYCDILTDASVKCRITSFSNSEITFNPGSIVNGSAVVVLSNNIETAPGKTWKNFFSNGPGVRVTQHIGDDVVFNIAPGPKEMCRVYFLVVLSAGTEIPEDYTGAPAYVRKMRAEYFDFIDLNSSNTEIVKGKKTFKSDVAMGSDLSVSGSISATDNISTNSLTIFNGAEANYVLSSTAMGMGKWQQNPLVSDGPPINCYAGQLWMKSPEYELFVFDKTRNCWLSVAERQMCSWCPQLVAHTYITGAGATTSDILPYKATLVGMIASSERGGVWAAELHVNNRAVPNAAITVGDDGRGFRMNLQADFNAGDKVQFFVNGHNVDKPKIEAIFKRSL